MAQIINISDLERLLKDYSLDEDGDLTEIWVLARHIADFLELKGYEIWR